MSLAPTNLFNIGSTSIPTLFFEARIHGGSAGSDELITQLGLSLTSNNVNVALFTRTSGIVLIASVGSYCAYRICAKYLGNEFLYTLSDAVRLDRLSRADSRLLHPAAEGYLTSRQSATFYEERARQRLCQLLRSLSEDDKAISAGGLSVLGSSGKQSPAVSHAGSTTGQRQRYRLISTRSGSPVRVVCTSNQILKRAMQTAATNERRLSDATSQGLAAIRFASASRDDLTVNTRKHVPLQGEDERCDGLSDLTSVSRIQPPPEALLRTNCCVDVDGELQYFDDDSGSNFDDNMSRSSFKRSAYGEPLSWDDEFRSGASVTNLLFRCDSSSNISELSAMKNLEAMWAVKDGEKHNHLDSSATSLILRLAGNDDLSNDDAASSVCPTNLAQLIESKCSVQSANYMYRSVHIDEENQSVVSASNESVLSANFTATLGASHDLWEVTSTASKPSRSDHEKDQSLKMINLLEPGTSQLMNESFTSKSSSSSRSQKKSAMFDSAIGTDFLSSDDEKSSVHGQTKEEHKTSETKRPVVKSSAKRSWLDKISEKPSPQHKPRRPSNVSSVAPSEQSLEWYDEVPTNQQNISTIDDEKGTPI